MSTSQKIRCVTTDLEKFIEELPMVLMRLEEVEGALDEKLEWREFKFLFKAGTSKLVNNLCYKTKIIIKSRRLYITV